MLKRTNKPTLYEHLMRQSRSGAVPPRVHEPIEPSSSLSGGPGELSNLLGVGRSIRLPVGYLFVAAAAAILLVVTSYAVGFSRGRHAQRAVNEEERQALLVSERENARIAEGIGRTSPEGTLGTSNTPGTGRSPGTSPGGTSPGGSGSSSGSSGDRTPVVGGSQPPRSGDNQAFRPIDTDPRQPDLNYFYLVTTTRENAVRVAEFCRLHGLEAYVVMVNNLARVVAAPGYRPEDEGVRRRLETDIRRIRELWRQQVGRDEIGMSPERYRG